MTSEEGSAAVTGSKGFRILEHTADVGVEAWGATLAETLAQAVLGMNRVSVGEGQVRSRKEARVEASGHDVESLLYDLLSEVLFVMETEHLVVGQVQVTVGAGRQEGHWRAEARLGGEARDAQRHHGLEVKAVTYHDLTVEETDSGWRARVILDI